MYRKRFHFIVNKSLNTFSENQLIANYGRPLLVSKIWKFFFTTSFYFVESSFCLSQVIFVLKIFSLWGLVILDSKDLNVCQFKKKNKIVKYSILILAEFSKVNKISVR
ncbi:hypothetical protein BpHYR1_032323 [Brachionus plicatilis]|uniref:Uncharacterized protein n=1 Tax=Brachionus plicatilis TaxID=10195 RepID=A0A3M7T0L2_BRAPC|nr:hypothetical protein BpHYR1_032323 [Brachionus plicatilis]